MNTGIVAEGLGLGYHTNTIDSNTVMNLKFVFYIINHLCNETNDNNNNNNNNNTWTPLIEQTYVCDVKSQLENCLKQNIDLQLLKTFLFGNNSNFNFNNNFNNNNNNNNHTYKDRILAMQFLTSFLTYYEIPEISIVQDMCRMYLKVCMYECMYV